MSVIGYVTLEDADEYVVTHFLSTDDLRISWESLTETDKEVLLRQSLDILESLPFTGRKTNVDQPYAFPRYPLTEIPENVKSSQIEIAVTMSDSSTSSDAAFYEKLWQYGIESYSIGNLSESSSSGTWGREIAKVVSPKASRLLQPFLTGGYNIKGIRK